MQVRGQILFICVDFDFLKLFGVNLFILLIEPRSPSPRPSPEDDPCLSKEGTHLRGWGMHDLPIRMCEARKSR